jgi:hypothetical protein
MIHLTEIDWRSCKPPSDWDRLMLGWRDAALTIRAKGGAVLFFRPARPVLGSARRSAW